MNTLLKMELRPVGAISKAAAIEYVGGPDYFAELERDYRLCPCRELKTRVLYRVAELDRCMEAAEMEIRNRRAARPEKKGNTQEVAGEALPPSNGSISELP